MLAALLCNLEPVKKRGTILRERSASMPGVQKAARQIEELLYPVPKKTREKVRKAVEKVYEYQELPTFTATSLGDAIGATQSAIRDIESLLVDLNEPKWFIDIQLLLQQLIVISAQLNDDEEAILLLM